MNQKRLIKNKKSKVSRCWFNIYHNIVNVFKCVYVCMCMCVLVCACAGVCVSACVCA